MDKRDEQFLNLYLRYRVSDMQMFYEARRKEFEKAQDQAFIMNTILMTMASLASVLGITNVGGLQILWGVLTALLPSLAAAILGYAQLYEFQERATSFRNAARTLHRAETSFRGVEVVSHNSNYRSKLIGFVDEVEEGIAKEIQQSYKSQNSPQEN